MDLSTELSVVALIVSIGSLGVTVWATRLSKKSLNHAIDIQEKGEEKEFERLRAELLMQIADSRRLLDKTRIEIGTLKADRSGPTNLNNPISGFPAHSGHDTPQKNGEPHEQTIPP